MFIGDAHHRRDAEPVGVFVGEGGHGCCAPQSMLHAVAGLPALGSASRRARDYPLRPQPALRAREARMGPITCKVAASTKNCSLNVRERAHA